MRLPDTVEPLIFTSKDNLPESSLRFEPEWLDAPRISRSSL